MLQRSLSDAKWQSSHPCESVTLPRAANLHDSRMPRGSNMLMSSQKKKKKGGGCWVNPLSPHLTSALFKRLSEETDGGTCAADAWRWREPRCCLNALEKEGKCLVHSLQRAGRAQCRNTYSEGVKCVQGRSGPWDSKRSPRRLSAFPRKKKISSPSNWNLQKTHWGERPCENEKFTSFLIRSRSQKSMQAAQREQHEHLLWRIAIRRLID